MIIAIIAYAALAAIAWQIIDDVTGWRRVAQALVRPAVCAVLLVSLVALAFLSIPRWLS